MPTKASIKETHPISLSNYNFYQVFLSFKYITYDSESNIVADDAYMTPSVLVHL